MSTANTIQNIINNIDSFFASLTETPPDSYIPLNYHNIKYMSFILCLFLFYIENIIIIFIKIITYTINYIIPKLINDKILNDLEFYINLNIFILIIVSLTFLNVFFIKDIIRFITYIIVGLMSVYAKAYIQEVYENLDKPIPYPPDIK